MSIEKSTRMAFMRSTALLVVKIAAFLITGSASLLASSIDSIADVVASAVAYKSRNVPHCEQHHIALIQTIWIAAGAGLVFVETLRNMNGAVEAPLAGVAILALTVVVDSAIVKQLTEKDPIVTGLREDIKADIMTSASALIALGAVYLTGNIMIDKIMALTLSVYLIAKGIALTHENMVEASIDHEELPGAQKVEEWDSSFLP